MNHLDIIACPYCKVNLEKESDMLICPKCSKQYPIKNGTYHLYHSEMDHWKMIIKAQEELVVRDTGYKISSYDNGSWIGSLTEDSSLYLRANNAMFNISLDFFGSDLYGFDYGLEFGCGQGWASTYLSKYRPMIALDSSEIMSGAIPSNVNKGITKIIADGQFMPILDNSIGIVFSCSALHHIHDRAMGVKEIYRILKDGGKYCGFGDLWTNENGMNDYWSTPETRDEKWLTVIEGRPYSKEELYSWFNVGFSKVHIQTMQYKPHMHEFGYLNIASDSTYSNLVIMVTK
jgi:SAM-dependent methyltransferase